MANITHDAQKERRERLKQKYGDKTQLRKTPQKMYRCGGKAGVGMWQKQRKSSALELQEPMQSF